MKVFLEYAEQPYLRSGDVRPASEFADLQGFRSVYGFAEEDATEIIRLKSSKDFKRFSQFSDCLFLDLDDGDVSVNAVRGWLKKEGLEFSLYKSGSKGFHFHIPCVPKFSPDVAWSQRKLVEGLGLPVDVSLYRPNSLIRLPGTIHRKTGLPKELVDSSSGHTLDYDLVEEPESRLQDFSLGDVSDFETTLLSLATYLANPPSSGNRHMTLWSHAERLRRQGLAYETVLDLLQGVNSSWGQNAKPRPEVERAVNQAFQKTAAS
jgi:hypothetical protein